MGAEIDNSSLYFVTPLFQEPVDGPRQLAHPPPGVVQFLIIVLFTCLDYHLQERCLMEIRLANEADLVALHKLDDDSADVDVINGEKFYVLRREGVIDYYLHEHGLFVAVDDDHIAGYVLAHIIEQMHAIDQLVWIEHIGVHPDFRGRGVGLALLHTVEEHYREKADAIYAEIHPLNESSLRLFCKWQDGESDRKCIYKSL